MDLYQPFSPVDQDNHSFDQEQDPYLYHPPQPQLHQDKLDIDEEWDEDDHRLEVNEGGPPLPLADDLPQQILAMSPPEAPPKPLQLNPEDQIVGEEEFPPTPGEIRISTMTATCHTNLDVNLAVICHYCPLVQADGSEKEGILKTMHQGIIRGASRRDKKTSKKTGKVFYNQATIILKLWKDTGEDEVNLKLFNNGNVQMTGLKSESDGTRAVNILYSVIRDLEATPEQIATLAEKLETEPEKIPLKAVTLPADEEFGISNFEIVLINSDYSAEFLIKRDVLHHLLINTYDIFSSYEPCTYPGVNSKYFWNEDYLDKPKKGHCYCTRVCNGKGNGKGNGNCKKVTIAIFQSGKLIITGAKTHTQINDAYNFINGVFRDNFQEIRRKKTLFMMNLEKEEQEEKQAQKEQQATNKKLEKKKKIKSKSKSNSQKLDSKKSIDLADKNEYQNPPEGVKIIWVDKSKIVT